MRLSFRLLIIFFSFCNVVNAHRWPWMIKVSYSPFSKIKSKYSICSRSSFNKKKIEQAVEHLFPYAIDLKSFYDEQPSLEEVCALARKNRSFVVRVLLNECDHVSLAQWNFVSDEGFMVQAINCTDGHPKKMVRVASFTVMIKQGSLFYKGKRLKHGVRLRSVNGHGIFNGVAYDGDFCIIPHKNSFLCINYVGLEDYIAAVLKTESWPGWPLEVNKVFAIACRSYVVFKVLEAKRTGRVFHVKNSNVHQTYQGRHDKQILKQAVKETQAMVLGFKGRPVLAMFDSCCGGIIPAHIADFDFYKAPYLARDYACTYCKSSSLYSWKVSYEFALFDKLLKEHNYDIARCKSIRIIAKDKAGLVKEVRFDGYKKHMIISGKQLYSMVKEIKSFKFDVCKKLDEIVFSGVGFGHHLGLCQWGARQMVREGFDYKSILSFYYPETQLMRLG